MCRWLMLVTVAALIVRWFQLWQLTDVGCMGTIYDDVD